MPTVTRVRRASLAETRAILARVALALPDQLPDPTLGDIRLHPHQQVAAARLAHALREFGGALLADDVGLGKTYVALALARERAPTVVVAPAALRDTWTRASIATGVACRFVSVESLSRPALAAASSDALAHARLVVVDEAHHLRNPATRRWRRLATLARHARLLLLSATPIHNTPRDLSALLSLFLGERARRLDAASLARLIVRRRGQPPGTALPVIARTRWHRLPPQPSDADLRDAILALPPPLPPRDGGLAATLGVLTLLRLLASGEDALRRAVRRRLARAAALDAALRDGRHLARRELRAWCGSDGDAVQLGLALDAATHGDATGLDALRAPLAAHADALRALLARLHRPDVDARTADRVAWLRGLRQRHPHVPIVAFTQFADSAHALYARLAPDGRVALLTATGGRIASGPVSRRELLARFAPRAAGLPPPPARERVDLLVATDCLSEGLDLRDAAVVVHLDVPWTPARLAQRAGRAARLDGPHACIAVHGLAPPRAVARALRLAARLHAKARAAARVVGVSRHVARHVAIAARLERWLGEPSPDPSRPRDDSLLVAAVRAPRAGFLAVCVVAGAPVLLASGGAGRPRVGGRTLAWAVRHVDRAVHAGVPDPVALAAALRAVRRWARRTAARRAWRNAGGPGVAAVLARADAVLAAAPAHRRPVLAVRAARLRAALAGPVAAGTEQALAALAPALAGEPWLDAALALVASPESAAGPAPYGPGPRATASSPPVVHALVLLVPPERPWGDSNLSSARPV